MTMDGIFKGTGQVRLLTQDVDGTIGVIGDISELTIEANIRPDDTKSNLSAFQSGKTQSFSMHGAKWADPGIFLSDPKGVSMIKEIKGTKNSFKIESDFETIDPYAITVVSQGVVLPKSEYRINTDGILTLKHYSHSHNSIVDLQVKLDNKQYMIRHKVLVLATSKMTPFYRLEEFAPDLFDALNIERLMKYPDNERHRNVFEASPDGKAYVLGYTIEKRGIYAKVKVYQDLY